MVRNLTGGLPVVNQGRLASLGPIRERLTLAHEKRQKGTPEGVGVSDRKTVNGENARMHETNTYANAMHMMTLYDMHEMNKKQNKEKNPTTKGIS